MTGDSGPGAQPAIVSYQSRHREDPRDRYANRGATLILAPGAGATQHHPFIVSLAIGLAERGMGICTFDFPYAVAGRRRPDTPTVLEQAWRETIATVRAERPPTEVLFIGGKSMGGRIATQVAAAHEAASLGVAGVVCLGYPLHPPGRGAPRRLAHLASVGVPILIIQGTRDRFGGPEAVRTAALGIAHVDVVAVDGADHGFAVPRRAGRSASQVLQGLADSIATWAEGVCRRLAAPR